MRPITVIGGGLAGLSLGVALRRAGVPVTLHEAGAYPRHRVCGEFITGLQQHTIDRLGLAEHLRDAVRNEEVAWHIAGGPARRQRLPQPALGISRFALDARLAATFVALGGDLRTRSRVTELADAPGTIFAVGRRRALQAEWIGLKVHARGRQLHRDLEMHLGHESYVGLSRIEDGSVNVCGLFRHRAVIERGPALLLAYLRAAGLDDLADDLAGADLEPESFCAIAALHFDRGLHEGARICLGDAGAAIPPFTGNGMAMALQSAELALTPLIEYAGGATDWSSAVKTTRAALRRRFRVRLASANALHPFLLRPTRQRWFARLSRVRLLPFRMLYASLH